MNYIHVHMLRQSTVIGFWKRCFILVHSQVCWIQTGVRTLRSAAVEWQITLLCLVIRWASLDLVVAGKTLPAWLKCVKYDVWLRRDVGLFCQGLCGGQWYASNFVEGPFLFQHDCSPVSKSRSIKTWLDEFGVEDLDWPSQSPDLNPIKHLWDEVEWKLRARPSCPKTVHDLTNAYWINGQKFPQKYSKILWPLKKCGSCYSCKGGQTPY